MISTQNLGKKSEQLDNIIYAISYQQNNFGEYDFIVFGYYRLFWSKVWFVDCLICWSQSLFGSRTRAKFEYAYRDLGTRQGQYRPRSLPHQPKNQICQSSKKFQFPFNNYQGVNARFLIYHATTWDLNCRRYKVFSFFRQ